MGNVEPCGDGLLPGDTNPITWSNVDLSSVRSGGIHLRSISQEMLKMSILDMSLKIRLIHDNIEVFQGPVS